MKSKTLHFTAMTLFAALAIPVQLAAQEQQEHKKENHQYKLAVIGTFGGPTSYDAINGFGDQILNNAGIVSGEADTSIPDPNAPNFCYQPDCFLSHAFRWQDGVLTDLGGLPGVNSSASGAINARGWSVGQSQNGLIDPLLGVPETRAVLWKDHQIIDLGTLGGNESLAAYVNDGGQVVGVAANTIPDPFSFIGWGTQTRAFLWEEGVMRDLGTLGGPDAIGDSGCRGNEPNGLVAGSSYTNFTPNPSTGIPTMDPFLWENGTMTDLGTLGGIFGTAQCANNRRQVIGQSSLAEDPGACLTGGPGCHAFLWDHGTLADLGTLGGTFSTTFWLNDAGDVVGAATTPGDALFHATLWRKGVITDLGTLDGDCFSQALAINSKGQIVGQSFSCDFSTVRAVLWEKGSISDLNTLIPPNSSLLLTTAFNINDRGEIVGWGAPPGVQDLHFGGRVFLLIPCGDDEERCGDSAVGTVPAAQSDPAPVASSPTTSVHRPSTPREIVAAWRGRLAQRYHIPGLGGLPPK
jgi:probable HAF family extracellular repeat protein